jgi:hypothetical protein
MLGASALGWRLNSDAFLSPNSCRTSGEAAEAMLYFGRRMWPELFFLPPRPTA